MSSGASRNFEPWRQKDQAADDEARLRAEEELGDAMKALENKTLDSKQEMDILATLDEMKSMRARQAGIDTTTMLQAVREAGVQREPSAAELAEEDEAVLRSVVFQNSATFVRRIEDEDEEVAGVKKSGKSKMKSETQQEPARKKVKANGAEEQDGRGANVGNGSLHVGEVKPVKATVVPMKHVPRFQVTPKVPGMLVKPKGGPGVANVAAEAVVPSEGTPSGISVPGTANVGPASVVVVAADEKSVSALFGAYSSDDDE